MQVSKRHVNYLAIVGVSFFFRPQQFQLKTKKKLFEPLTIQNSSEVTSSVTVSTQWLKTGIKAKQICKVLRAVRLFEPDRNEEKWTNEHVYWEQRMSNFFINEPIRFKWKHKASCRENKQTSDLSGNFVILWLVIFDPKLSPCLCLFWSRVSFSRNSFL